MYNTYTLNARLGYAYFTLLEPQYIRYSATCLASTRYPRQLFRGGATHLRVENPEFTHIVNLQGPQQF